MLASADTSFLVRLLVPDAGSEEAIAIHRQMGRPQFYFSPLHELEVTNAIRLRSFTAIRDQPRNKYRIRQEEDAAFGRLQLGLRLSRFIPWSPSWVEVFTGAAALSERHAKRIGVRSLDLLQVQIALLSPSKIFVTCDKRQGALARAAGLDVTLAALS